MQAHDRRRMVVGQPVAVPQTRDGTTMGGGRTVTGFAVERARRDKIRLPRTT